MQGDELKIFLPFIIYCNFNRVPCIILQFGCCKLLFLYDYAYEYHAGSGSTWYLYSLLKLFYVLVNVSNQVKSSHFTFLIGSIHGIRSLKKPHFFLIMSLYLIPFFLLIYFLYYLHIFIHSTPNSRDFTNSTVVVVIYYIQMNFHSHFPINFV